MLHFPLLFNQGQTAKTNKRLRKASKAEIDRKENSLILNWLIQNVGDTGLESPETPGPQFLASDDNELKADAQ